MVTKAELIESIISAQDTMSFESTGKAETVFECLGCEDSTLEQKGIYNRQIKGREKFVNHLHTHTKSELVEMERDTDAILDNILHGAHGG